MQFCFTCETLDADFRMWNIKFSIIHIYKSGERIFNLKYRILCTSYENVWTQNFLQNNVEFFILELWKSGCRFFDRKLKKKNLSHIPTWSYETWKFFIFVIWKHLWSLSFMKYWVLSNIWNTCVNFPTRNIEFAHRFMKSSDMRFEILSLPHLTIRGEMFSYEIWILKFSHVKHFPYSSTRKIILHDSEIKAWAKWQTSNSYISCISQITHRIFCISLMKIWVRISLEEIGN